MRTLAQLRTAVYQALGFIDPFANVQTRTLAELRTSLAAVGGYAAQAASLPPGMNTLLDEFINAAQDTAWRRYPPGNQSASLPSRMTATSDTTTLDYVPVFNLAAAMLRGHQGRNDVKSYYDRYEQFMADMESRRPANAQSTVDQALQDAQRALYRRFPWLETERTFAWTLSDGVSTYDLTDSDASVSEPAGDPDSRKVTWVGIERDNRWIELECGIPPELYSYNSSSGWPTRYEIRRDVIELWPVPGSDTQTLQIRGHLGLGAFTSDAHEATVDDHAIFLMAMATCCEAFQMHPRVKGKNPQTWFGKLEAYIRNLVAGQHHTARYIPNEPEWPLYIEPRPTVPHA